MDTSTSLQLPALDNAYETLRYGSIRIGDAERESICQQLSEHYAAGRLDQFEMEERVKTAVGAKTRADLGLLVHDLPPLVAAPAQRPLSSVHSVEPVMVNSHPARMALDVGIGLITLCAIICTAFVSLGVLLGMGGLLGLAFFGLVSSIAGVLYVRSRFVTSAQRPRIGA